MDVTNVISVPLVPDHAGKPELAASAAGQRDAAFAALGTVLASTGVTSRIIVRLDRALNGDWCQRRSVHWSGCASRP